MTPTYQWYLTPEIPCCAQALDFRTPKAIKNKNFLTHRIVSYCSFLSSFSLFSFSPSWLGAVGLREETTKKQDHRRKGLSARTHTFYLRTLSLVTFTIAIINVCGVRTHIHSHRDTRAGTSLLSPPRGHPRGQQEFWNSFFYNTHTHTHTFIQAFSEMTDFMH